MHKHGSWSVRRGRRLLALLGGTTSWGDCAVAAGHLLMPWTLQEGSSLGRYERAFARRVGRRHAVSFAAGRTGLYGLLRAHGIGEGDEVLLQAPTHIVVPNAVRATGARPVFVDCRREDWNIDMEDAARRASPRTRALLLQHTFGVPADLDAARELCRERGLLLVEDCVHALGATWRGRPVGSLGDCAFFSTEETKTISTTMGGVAVTDDDAIAGQLRAFQRECEAPPRGLTARYLVKLLAIHALTPPRVHLLARTVFEALGKWMPLPTATEPGEMAGGLGANFSQRLSNAQASLGVRQLRRLDANVAHRRALASAYAEELGRLGYPPPAVHPAADPSPLRHVVEVDDRQRAWEALRPHTIVGTWFTSVLEEADSPEAGGYEPGSCPTAEIAASKLVNLPTHARVRLSDVPTLASALAPYAPPAGDGARAGALVQEARP